MPIRSMQVAHATIDNDVRFKILAVAPEKGKVGDTLRIVLTYEIDETSAEEDAWNFQLKSQVGNDVQETREVRKDRRVVIDDYWSHVATEHALTAAGTVTGTFSAEVELVRRKWGSNAPFARVAKANCEGQFTIAVA